MKPMINIALPKGRLGESVYETFEKAGYGCPALREGGRRLIYVERGAADIGVAGKDILLEYTPDVYELLDLGVGKCRMAVAAKNGFRYDGAKTLRVATKFVNIARTFYNEQSRDIDIIKLNGSIELAPILGLSDVIVDIVETGTTLKENDLSVIETIVPISARLIANKVSYKFQYDAITKLSEKIAALTAQRAQETK